jgi:hypothetical protein
MSGFISYLFLALVVGAVSAYIAKRKGRDAMLWFLGGFFFNALAIGAVIALKDRHNRSGRPS